MCHNVTILSNQLYTSASKLSGQCATTSQFYQINFILQPQSYQDNVPQRHNSIKSTLYFSLKVIRTMCHNVTILSNQLYTSASKLSGQCATTSQFYQINFILQPQSYQDNVPQRHNSIKSTLYFSLKVIRTMYHNVTILSNQLYTSASKLSGQCTTTSQFYQINFILQPQSYQDNVPQRHNSIKSTLYFSLKVIRTMCHNSIKSTLYFTFSRLGIRCWMLVQYQSIKFKMKPNAFVFRFGLQTLNISLSHVTTISPRICVADNTNKTQSQMESERRIQSLDTETESKRTTMFMYVYIMYSLWEYTCRCCNLNYKYNYYFHD